MSERVCSIGVDFGTESGRALLLDARTGEELAVSVVPYASGVIDASCPATGERLPTDWALQDPDDWVAVLESGDPRGRGQRPASRPTQVVGIGVDFTSCTVLPVDRRRRSRCVAIERWRARRHAWPKLWKHHAAQPVADRLNEVALERGEDFLQRYGGRISSEWYFPKLIELWLEDREVYDAAAALHRGHRLDHLAADRARVPPDLHRRLQGDVVTRPTGSRRGPTSRPPIRASTDPAAKLGTQFAPLGTRAGTLAAELGAAPGARRGGGGGGRQRRLVRVGAGRRRAAARARS